MENMGKLLTTTSPHLHEGTNTKAIMWTVTLCLLPAGAWGVYVFGTGSLFILAVSILSALLTEFLITVFKKRITVLDGSAFLTGLLVGYNMPPQVPLFIPICASIFGIAIVKHTFGGLGANWMNPALAGRAFAMFSWSKAMNQWTLPVTLLGSSGADAVTGATPLGTVKAGIIEISAQFQDTAGLVAKKLQELKGSMHLLATRGYPVSSFDTGITDWFNSTFGLSLNKGYFDLFFGNVGGCIGEVSVFLLLLGTIYLFIRKIITWEIPVSYVGSFALLTWIFGGLRFAGGLFQGDIFFHLFTGGLVLGAFYMATDMVTSPLSRKGMIIFGCGAGLLTFLIRFYGSLPEGVSLAIIIMNICVPLIDRYTQPVIFGTVKEAKE